MKQLIEKLLTNCKTIKRDLGTITNYKTILFKNKLTAKLGSSLPVWKKYKKKREKEKQNKGRKQQITDNF